VATVRPFWAIMYDPARVDVGRVVAPPYDVIGPRDQQRYHEQDPHNVVRLIAGEVRATDNPEDNKYLRAAQFFKRWLDEGVLRREPGPALFLYRHEFIDPTTDEAKTRQGILGVVELEPFGRTILPHERTHARAKADRLSLTRAVVANLSPIFALYSDPKSAVGCLIEPVFSEPPRLAIRTEDGDRHTVWSLRAPGLIHEIVQAFEPSLLYVADGHHRYETALNFRNKMRLEHPDAAPNAAFNYVLTLLVAVSDPGLTILPTHRLLHDAQPFDAAALVQELRRQYRVQVHSGRTGLLEALRAPTVAHRIGVALPDAWLTVDIEPATPADPVSTLDVSLLHRDILQRVLGLKDDLVEEEHVLSYSRDLDAVLEEVESGAAQAAFLLRPPAVIDVVAVASAGQVMPQKSTYFYPKPASGIVFNPLDPSIRIPAV
jgi:uncharacterized protein (DUF1015 family)